MKSAKIPVKALWEPCSSRGRQQCQPTWGIGDSSAWGQLNSAHPPVEQPFAVQLKPAIVGIDLAALPIPQLHTQHIGLPVRQEVHGFIAQPVLARRIPKALGEPREGGCG